MKPMNLYMKVDWENRTPTILDVRWAGQKVSKKYWKSIYFFFDASWYEKLCPLNEWSEKFDFIYKNRKYKAQTTYTFKFGETSYTYKMKIYK